MQREAEQRVREMQARARLVGGDAPPVNQPIRRNFSGGQPTNLQRENAGALPFGLDNDRLIILALLWVLYSEGADSKLLLALLYLLL